MSYVPQIIPKYEDKSNTTNKNIQNSRCEEKKDHLEKENQQLNSWGAFKGEKEAFKIDRKS